MSWQVLLSLVGALGGATAITTLLTLGPTIRRLRAEARRQEVDAAVAEDSAEDAHWKALLQAQVELVVQPLREEVARLREEVAAARADAAVARAEVTRHRARYWRAVAYIRELLNFIHRHVPHTAAPPAPAEIAEDV